MNRPVDKNKLYFRNESVACVVCMSRTDRGKWRVHAIVPDGKRELSVEEYKAILNEFDREIAGPAAESVEGLSAIDVSQHRLDDYFSRDQVQLLRQFIANATFTDFGSHPLDQKRWLGFLLSVYADRTEVSADVFRACLRTEGSWPEEAISKLAYEFDFAMRLLKQLEEER